MIFSRFLTLVLCLLILSSTGCDTPEDTMMPDGGPASGTITVKVVSLDGLQSPVAGVPVALNSEDGQLLANGVTGTEGTFVVNDVPRGASATIANEEASLGPVIQTKFDLVPEQTNKTYTFMVSVPSTDLGTVTVTGTNIPGAGTYQIASIGECNNSLGSPITVTSRCVQSDGKISIYAVAMDNTRQVHGRAMALDLTFLPGMTVNLSDWYSNPLTSVNISATNAAGELLTANFDLITQRLDTEFRLEASDYGTLNGSEITGIRFLFPTDLPVAEKGQGFRFTLGYSARVEHGTRYGGIIARQQWIENQMQFDLSKLLPETSFNGAWGDFGEANRPAIGWDLVAGETIDAALAMMTWPNAGRDVYWVATVPAGNGYVQVPELPSTMNDFLPPEGGVAGGPLVFAVDSAQRDGYDAFAKDDSGLALLIGRLPGGDTTYAVKYVASPPTDVLLKKAGETNAAPNDGGLLKKSPMLRQLLKQ